MITIVTHYYMLPTGQLADDKQNNFKLHTIVLDELHRSIGTECLRKQCYHSCNPDSVQNPQFSLFQGQWLRAALWALRHNCAKWKYFNSNLCRMLEDVLIKGLCSRILVYLVWPWYLIPEQQSCMQKTGSMLQDTMSILCSPLAIQVLHGTEPVSALTHFLL